MEVLKQFGQQWDLGKRRASRERLVLFNIGQALAKVEEKLTLG